MTYHFLQRLNIYQIVKEKQQAKFSNLIFKLCMIVAMIGSNLQVHQFEVGLDRRLS